jgi:hypothetical protein
MVEIDREALTSKEFQAPRSESFDHAAMSLETLSKMPKPWARSGEHNVFYGRGSLLRASSTHGNQATSSDFEASGTTDAFRAQGPSGHLGAWGTSGSDRIRSTKLGFQTRSQKSTMGSDRRSNHMRYSLLAELCRF